MPNFGKTALEGGASSTTTPSIATEQRPGSSWLVPGTPPTPPQCVNIINKGLALLPAKPEGEPLQGWLAKIRTLIVNPTWTLNTLTVGGTLFAQFINIANTFEETYSSLKADEKEAAESELYKLYATFSLIAPKDRYDKFYNQACNVLWALFHRVVEDNDTITDIYAVKTEGLISAWPDYLAMNVAYADRYITLIQNNNINTSTPVWIHDYQLMLVPHLIRTKLADKEIPPAPIGFFCHIPIPSVKAFKSLGEAAGLIIKETVIGMLGADMCGFQTNEYRDNFLTLAKHFKLPINETNKTVTYEGRTVRISTHPIGINFEKYTTANKTDEVNRITQFKGRGGKLILAIERADPAKCIPAKLLAFKLYLEGLGDAIKTLEPADLPSFLLVAVPTRIDQPAYIAENKKIDTLVNEINQTFASKTAADWKPVHCVHVRINSPEEMTALYQEADINVVTSKRDGMNLSAKECIAASYAKLQPETQASSSSTIERPVVMILSDRMGAGTAEQLGGDSGAITITPVIKDPYAADGPYIENVAGLSTAIEQALNMPLAERKTRLKTLAEQVKSQGAKWWVDNFMSDLTSSRPRATCSGSLFKPEATDTAPPCALATSIVATVNG